MRLKYVGTEDCIDCVAAGKINQEQILSSGFFQDEPTKLSLPISKARVGCVG